MGVNSLEKLRKTKCHYPLAMSQRTGSRRAQSGEDTAWDREGHGDSTATRPRALDDLEASSSPLFSLLLSERWAREATQEDPLEPPGTSCPRAGQGGLCALRPRCHTLGVRCPAARPGPLRSGALFPSGVTATHRHRDPNPLPLGPPTPGSAARSEMPLLPYSVATLLGQPHLLPVSPRVQPPPAAHPQRRCPVGGMTAPQERAG